MADSCTTLLTLSLFAIAFLILSPGSVTAGGVDHHFGWAAPLIDGGGGEFGMESEMSRRILATSQYISYGALQRDRVPCSRRGASYYNCKPGATANPYSRGCSAIARCRS